MRRTPAAPKDAEAISGLGPIAESAAKGNKILINHLLKTIEELNNTIQPSDQFLYLGLGDGITVSDDVGSGGK